MSDSRPIRGRTSMRRHQIIEFYREEFVKHHRVSRAGPYSKAPSHDSNALSKSSRARTFLPDDAPTWQFPSKSCVVTACPPVGSETIALTDHTFTRSITA